VKVGENVGEVRRRVGGGIESRWGGGICDIVSKVVVKMWEWAREGD